MAGEVTSIYFPLLRVTPLQAVKETFWDSATAAGTDAGADIGNLLFLITAAQGCKEMGNC